MTSAPDRRLSVAFLLPKRSSSPSGGYRVAYEYANRLAAFGHSCTVAHLEPLPSRLAAGLRHPRTALRRDRFDWFAFDPRVRVRTWGGVSRRALQNFDVVIATAWWTAAALGPLRRPGQTGIYLLQSHETWHGPADRVDSTFRLGLTVVAVSSWLAEVARERGAERVEIVLNGIDHGVFRPGQPRSSDRRVAMMWHPDVVKGSQVALGVIDRLLADERTVVDVFSAFPAPPGMPRRVRFHFRPSQAELVRVYQDAAVFISPSLSEGFGLPAIEAMACGAALVAADIPGIADYAVNGVTASLVPPGDAAALASATLALLDDPARRDRLVSAASEVVGAFDVAAAAERFERVVCAAAERARRGD